MAIGKTFPFPALIEGQENLTFVSEVGNFPAPSAGVIQLEDNMTYFLNGTVDLEGNRLVGGQNTTLQGGSSENTFLISTGLDSGTAILSSEWTIICRFLTITHGTALDLDASSNPGQALDWLAFNFTNCADVGVIRGYNNAVFNTCAVLNSSGLTFDGTIGSVVFVDSLIQANSTGTGLTIPSTATLTRRLRITNSVFNAPTGTTAIDVSTSASIPVEGYILDTVNFSGPGTYTSVVQFDDNKSNWTNCIGVTNSSNVAQMTMTGNATATVISTSNTPTKVAGTTTSQPITQRFSHSANRLTSDGAVVRAYKITCVLSFTSGNNNVIGGYIALNGSVIPNSESSSTANSSGRSENVFIQTVTTLNEGDYVEIFVENQSSTNNITVSDMNVIIEPLR